MVNKWDIGKGPIKVMFRDLEQELFDTLPNVINSIDEIDNYLMDFSRTIRNASFER